MTTLDTTVSLMHELIAFPTVSSDGNLALIEFAAEYLESMGAKVEVFSDTSGAKANLFATLGPAVDGGIVLSGHTDVVPVAGQPWTSDPFTLTERDGLLYGRGACDMKGFIACALATAGIYAEADLKRPVHFAFTHDEEVGCIGAQALMPQIQKMPMRPSIAIIGEPTEMRIIEGHKGSFEYTVEFSGLAGHASTPSQGVNAVEYAIRYVARLMELGQELPSRAPASSRFEPPWTTVQVGRMAGGVAHNVIPDNCSVDWEMRPVQKTDADYVKAEITTLVDAVLRPQMQAVHPGADIKTLVVGEVAGLEPVPDSEARRIVSELTGANTAGVVSFGTEAGLFQEIGIPTVVCGPGSIDQAHKADEFVAPEQLQRALDMLARLVPKLAAD